MKTLTEFPGLNIKNAAKVMQDLSAGGKTQEELPTAVGEALKLEGDRLNFMMNALAIVGTQFNDLKRVVVYSLLEGEKAPSGILQKGDHYYLVEYFPSLNQKSQRGPQEDRPGDRKRKGRGKPGEGGRGAKNGERAGGQNREPRPPRISPAATQSQTTPGKPPVITPKKAVPPKPS